MASCREEQFLSGLPVDAGVGDALAVDELIEWLGEFLGTGDEVAFEHGSDDRGVSGCALAEDFLEDGGH